jgi:thiol-disulfide isomerase/thioredoxin
MDRLPTLSLGALCAFAGVLALSCDKGDSPAPPASRAEGAKVSATQKASTEAFCDFHKADDSGPLLQVPALGEVKVTSKPGSWTWLNIWATWCKPCVEEMPRVAKWRDKLAASGKQLELAFVSVDEDDATVAAFQSAHPGSPRTARLADPKTQTDWFKQLGLDSAPPIPIHVFVSPTGHVRCARAGSVRDQDFAAIELLLAE